ncbi:Glyoxalase-like domain-containing protein [Dyella sp. OK004]|uniref:VOC family protein n=1 Tax=Dyella sp. OK004 TaxID=1855292 RepID=UPI0008E1A022|nr:VOC family protein [Dyella sp. OK004]SFS15069.1 Glyoxalase-like domain-containing protein [Dyella sp. OK004]
MPDLHAVEIKAFIPARDYDLSRRFYADVGFEERSEFKGVAYFALGECSFLLQNFYNEAHANNFMMHLLVDDADAWHRRFTEKDILGIYGPHGARMNTPGDREWGMRDFHLIDPTGVLWHIGHNIR